MKKAIVIASIFNIIMIGSATYSYFSKGDEKGFMVLMGTISLFALSSVFLSNNFNVTKSQKKSIIYALIYLIFCVVVLFLTGYLRNSEENYLLFTCSIILAGLLFWCIKKYNSIKSGKLIRTYGIITLLLTVPAFISILMTLFGLFYRAIS